MRVLLVYMAIGACSAVRHAAGKKLPVVIAAIAHEMAAFLCAIGRETAPVYPVLRFLLHSAGDGATGRGRVARPFGSRCAGLPAGTHSARASCAACRSSRSGRVEHWSTSDAVRPAARASTATRPGAAPSACASGIADAWLWLMQCYGRSMRKETLWPPLRSVPKDCFNCEGLVLKLQPSWTGRSFTAGSETGVASLATLG